MAGDSLTPALAADYQDGPVNAKRIAYYLKRKSGLEAERSTFRPHWMEISQFISPRSGRYFWSDVNRGDKRYNQIFNTRATQSFRSARAGLFAGIMGPSYPWLKLETPDTDLMEYQPVAVWFYKVEKLLEAIFNSGNLYAMAPMTIGEVLLFGTAAMSHMDDFDDVATFYHHPIGSYTLAQNGKYKIDTIGRQYQDTVKMLVETYGKNVSQTVRTLYDNGNYEAKIPVYSFIEPNREFDPKKKGSQFKKFRSVVMELGGAVSGAPYAVSLPDTDRFLSDKGFDEFPVHCPRWDVTGEDTYATDCPGMTTLGDVKSLQALERQSLRANDKMIDPPLHGPASLRKVKINTLPNGVVLYDGMDQQELKPIYTVAPQMDKHLMLIEAAEKRIREGFYEDLFRSIDSMEGVQPQNELFLTQKEAQRLLMLGPVLERLHGDFLQPLVARTFNQCMRAGLFVGQMEPPQELQGRVIKVRFVSKLAQAQRSVAKDEIEQFTGFVANLTKAGFQSASDNLDIDDAVRKYNKAIGAPPSLLRPPQLVAQVRSEHQQAAAQQAQVEQASTAAGALQQGAQGVASLAQAGNTAQQTAAAAPPSGLPPT